MKITIIVLSLIWLAVSTAAAEVVRIEVQTRNDVAEGKSYGLAGTYEKLVGKIYYEVDPNNSVNQIITDIEYAPTNAAGKVEFSSDFYLIKPRNIESGNGVVLFDVLNRGRKNMISRFNRAVLTSDPQADADMGDGFLLRKGFSLLWVGWQFDPPRQEGLMRVYPPIASVNGEPIRGLVRSNFVVTEDVFDHSLAARGHIAYPAADRDDPNNVMTVRDAPTGVRQVIPRERWKFARWEEDHTIPDPTMVYLEAGFEPGRIYEVVFTSQDPPIAGLGLAAIRDTISLLKYGSPNTLSIPLGSINRSIAYGRSQSGRLLRTFLYHGFNEDEHHRKVFDGVIAQVAGAGRGSFNYRFAQPSRARGSFFYPTEMFPFSDAVQTELTTGLQDGLLARVVPVSMPKIFYTNSSTEYWSVPGALIHTTVDGGKDVPPLDNVRIYHFAGTQHRPAQFPPNRSSGELLANPNEYIWFMRSLLLAMDRWITDGTLPPLSRFPMIEDGTLVQLEQVRFPEIPHVRFPTAVHRAYRLDYGPHFASEGIITKEPPDVHSAFPFLVPQVDENGNEISSLRSPELAVPLATYTGWHPFNPTSSQGLYVPFARTRYERAATEDPRPSIEERYQTREHYLGRITTEALQLIEQGYLLGEDMPEIVRLAGAHWDHLMSEETLSSSLQPK